MRLEKQFTMAFLVGSLSLGLVAEAANRPRIMSLAPAPKPENETTIENQLKRFRGQTQFLNYHSFGGWDGMPEGGPAGKAERSSTGGARAQQESDVFKVGKPGSKLLYLLNNYRGLQVVSFEKGAEQPALLGRVPATGNWPNDMYLDSANDRLIVLENMWYDDSGNYSWDSQQSRLVIYDVKNPAEPKIAATLPVQGEIAESRMVGDVLYLATSIRPNYYARNNGTELKPQGMVHSFRLTADGVELVQSLNLALPASYRENMNIVEVKDGESYKYYLLAVLSESGWGWWDNQSLVEVVDISDAKGAIEPVMVVSAKGMINERSQTTIKNGTLIVTSQYQNQATNNLTRIAVETFTLPTSKSDVIDEDEAEFRKRNIDRKLKGKSGEEREKLYQTLIADADLGILGRFVRTAEGKLRKIVSDSVVTVGDTTGLSARLQDVRYEGNTLFAFWVPANNIDPLDLFDISHPETGVKYVKRLQFDGWIERAIPLQYQGHQFVLGLGWVVPAVNNENNRRHPQAMLFEIEGEGANARAVERGSLVLESSKIWTSFNTADKFIEVRMGEDGKGVIMFAASSYENNRYTSGGKLIGFNLDGAIVPSQLGNVFQEGALLTADSGWLRRVFTNSEIEMMNTFTDMQLGTYDVKDIGKADQTADAISTLELARNISAYLTLERRTPLLQVRGVQVISDYNYYSADSSSTTLRLVEADKADSEQAQVLSELRVPGNYAKHLLDRRDGTLWIVTTAYTMVQVDGQDQWRTKYIVTRLGLEGATADKLGVLAQTSMTPDTNGGWWWGMGMSLVQQDSGEILFSTGSKLHRLGFDATGTMQTVEMVDCATEGKADVNLQLIGKTLYLSYSELVKDTVNEELTFSRNFVAPIALQGAKATCAAAINIPGRLIATPAANQLITEDDRVLDVGQLRKKEKTEGENEEAAKRWGWNQNVSTQRALEALVLLPSGKASLQDDYELPKGFYDQFVSVGAGRLAHIEWDQQASWDWGFERDWWPGRSIEGRMNVLALDSDARFTKEVFVLDRNILPQTRLSAVIVDPVKAGKYLGVLTTGRNLQILTWTEEDFRPEVVRVQALDARNQKQEAADSVLLSGWYGYWYGDMALNFTASQRSFELPQGVFGVSQLYLE